MLLSIKRTVPLGVALISGLVTCALFVNYRQALGAAAPTPSAPPVPMVVVAAPLSETRAISREDLSITMVAARPEGSFESPDQLIGRMPLVPVPKGQPILTSHLAAIGAQADLWHRVTPGMRAIAVAVNEVVGVGGFLRVGVKVDIIQVTQLPNGMGAARTIVQNVTVLALAQDDQHKEETKARVTTSATLLVTPQQAEVISQASEVGQIRLVLRAPGDRALLKVQPAPVAPRPAPAVVSHPASPARPRVVVRVAPAPAPQAFTGVEVISGKESEVVQP